MSKPTFKLIPETFRKGYYLDTLSSSLSSVTAICLNQDNALLFSFAADLVDADVHMNPHPRAAGTIFVLQTWINFNPGMYSILGMYSNHMPINVWGGNI